MARKEYSTNKEGDRCWRQSDGYQPPSGVSRLLVTALRLSPTFALFASRCIPTSPASVHLIVFYFTILGGSIEVNVPTFPHVELHVIVFDSINGGFPISVDMEDEFLW